MQVSLYRAARDHLQQADAILSRVDTDALAATAGSARPQLLERLAVVLCDAVLATDAGVRSATVTVRKLRPPVPHLLDSSGVRATRRRSS